jgi:8-oxo-dGTP pyrophosphatase MutT (NUDIX family)
MTMISKPSQRETLRRGSGPLDAATVILARDDEKRGLEIFLMRRHRNQEFMGGAFVFPGGKLDEGDCDPLLMRHIHAFTPEDARRLLQEGSLDPEKALGLFIAAIRELFEETGVLLAIDRSGKAPVTDTPHAIRHFGALRERLHENRITLRELAMEENLRFTPGLLAPYAHWITPEIESRRFDARFFIARLPERQTPRHDNVELTESRWMTPAGALEEHRKRMITLMPPTLKTVEELGGFATVGELFESASSRRIYPILPQAFSEGGDLGVRLPHDPGYTIEAYRQPLRSDDPSRIVLRDGVWRTARA